VLGGSRISATSRWLISTDVAADRGADDDVTRS
jgi:hypothetical protein